MTAQKSALVFGATGLIGRQLLHMLLDSPEYDRVTAVTRRVTGVEHPKLVSLIADLQSLSNISAQLVATDVFCCLGTTRKKTPDLQDYYRVDHDYPVKAATFAKENGAKSFLFVSAIGANAGSSNFYLRMKGETERDLAAVGFEKLLIFRPSLLTGQRKEVRWMEKLSEGLFSVVNPLLVGRWSRYRSIPATTVAHAMYRVAQKDIYGTHIYYGNEMRNIT